jgi:predicted nucleic acid-binding protein
LSQLLRQARVAANLTTDVHLAALAIEYGAYIHSSDSDFRRFAGLRFENPLED